MNTSTLVLLFALMARFQWGGQSLDIGKTIEAEITDAAPEVHTPTLTAAPLNVPTVGVAYRIEVEESGPYTIEVRSFDFDPYIFLRDSQGDLLLEDDDGLYYNYARIVVELERGVERFLTVCSPGGNRGTFNLRLFPGTPSAVAPEEKARINLEEAYRAVAYAESQFGVQHAKTAASLVRLATFLEASGEYEDALRIHERALAILEEQLGPAHFKTAFGLNNFGILLYRSGKLEQAYSFFERSLSIYEEHLGEGNPSIRLAVENCASVLFELGEYSRAMPLIERSVALREKQLGPDHLWIGIDLCNLAVKYADLGLYKKAKPFYERALAILEVELGPDHPEVGAAMDNMAIMHSQLGHYREQRALLKRVLVIVETEFGPDHLETAKSLHNLAKACGSMGDYARAMTLFERSLAIREAQLGSYDLGVAETNRQLGSLFHFTGDYEKSRAQYERALSIFEDQLGSDHPDTAIGLSDLGLLLSTMGELTKAKVLLERALAINQSQLGPEDLITAGTLDGLGGVLREMGDYAAARPLLERALAIREKQLGPDHVTTATSLNNLGFLIQEMGNFDEVVPLYKRALAIWERELGSNHPAVAVVLNNLAFVLESVGKYELAKPFCEEALAIREATLGSGHPLTASSMQNLASLLRALGESDEAKLLLERALEIFEEKLGSAHPDTAGALNDLALLLQDLGELDRARPLLERALAVFESQVGINHPATLTILNNLALLLLNLRMPEKTWELVRRGQIGMRKQLGSILAARTQEESKLYLATYRWQQEIALSVPRSFSNSAIESEAMTDLLAWKGQVGRAARSVRRLMQESQAARAISKRLRDHQEELSRLAFDSALAREERQLRIDELKTRVSNSELELRELIGLDSLDAIDVEAIRSFIPDNAALLSFFVQKVYQPAQYEGNAVLVPGNWTDPHLVAWIVRPTENVVSVDLGSASVLEGLTRGYLDDLVGSNSLGPTGSRGVAVARTKKEHNSSLRIALWDPLVQHLQDASLVLISNDRFTASLPFEVMMDERERYLIEDYSFVYLHDLQSLAALSKTTSSVFDTLFVVGGVNFDGRDKPAQLLAASFRGDSSAPSERWQSWRRLESTRIEAEAIVSLHEELVPHGTRTLVSGREATEERVLAEMPHSSVVHLATHGFFQPEGLPSMVQAARERTEQLLPFDGFMSRNDLLDSDRKLAGYLPEVLSGLVFAGANLEREEGRLDGYLTAADVDWMDLTGVEIVTLSACETGLGRSESGEGMSGFRTTLLRAGAKTVVSSLWQVPDDSTEKLMRRFYENLLRNKLGKLESLREAQLWMLRENRRRYDGEGRPNSWGAFVLNGDWR